MFMFLCVLETYLRVTLISCWHFAIILVSFKDCLVSVVQHCSPPQKNTQNIYFMTSASF